MVLQTSKQLFEGLLDDTKRVYREQFGEEPKVIVAAPGRVNLIGEHTDYNGGFVFPLAIERYTIIAASPNDDDYATVYTHNFHERAKLSLAIDVEPGLFFQWDDEKKIWKASWKSYVQGAIAYSGRHSAELKKGFNAVINSNVPLGGGLSSSASLEVAVATLMEELSGHKFGKTEKPLLCQQTEWNFALMKCGVMDQFISALADEGCAMLLDCRSEEPEMVPMSDESVAVLITNSNVKHELTGSEYPERRRYCEIVAKKFFGVEYLRDVSLKELLDKEDEIKKIKPETPEDEKKGAKFGEALFKYARHAISEDVRTLKAKDALVKSDWATVGEQMYASHASLRDDYEVSCPEIDALVEIAREIGTEGGVFGSRITGGGFGGCAVSLVKADKVGEITKKIQEEYKKRVGKEATIFSTRPAQGARVLFSAK